MSNIIIHEWSFPNTHSVLSDKSGNLRLELGHYPLGNSLRSSLDNPLLPTGTSSLRSSISSQSLECDNKNSSLGNSALTQDARISESSNTDSMPSSESSIDSIKFSITAFYYHELLAAQQNQETNKNNLLQYTDQEAQPIYALQDTTFAQLRAFLHDKKSSQSTSAPKSSHRPKHMRECARQVECRLSLEPNVFDKNHYNSCKALNTKSRFLESHSHESCLDSKDSRVIAKEKGVYPHPAPLNPEKDKAPLSFSAATKYIFWRESLALSASSSSVAEALLPPFSSACAPRSGREAVFALRANTFNKAKPCLDSKENRKHSIITESQNLDSIKLIESAIAKDSNTHTQGNSKICDERLDFALDSRAEGFEMRNRSFQGMSAGATSNGSNQANDAESTIYRSKPTPKSTKEK